MTGPKTNERPGTRAQVRYVRMSAYKAREVLDLIRGSDVQRADDILRFSERDAAIVIRKCLASAVANAEHNDSLPADELFVSACFADEGITIKRWRPRARGRATRIRKRTCHITIIVSRLDEDALERRRARESARPGSRAARRAGQQQADRRRRVARSRRADRREEHDHEHPDDEPAEAADVAEDDVVDEPDKAAEAEVAEDDVRDEPDEGADETATADADEDTAENAENGGNAENKEEGE